MELTSFTMVILILENILKVFLKIKASINGKMVINLLEPSKGV
jgi:hypothetical protein